MQAIFKCPKRTFLIAHGISPSMFSQEQITLLESVGQSATELGMEVYLVGGVVRDLGLALSPHDRDLDFIVEGDATKFAEAFTKKIGGEVKNFPKFLTAKIVNISKFSTIEEVDFATARTEEYAEPGSLPTVSAASIDKDLSRRDFTINAIALPLVKLLEHLKSGDVFKDLKANLLDPFSGLKDLEDRKIRVLHDKSFLDDPTRLYRACRYLVRINGSFESDTKDLMDKACANDVLSTVSKFRLFNEVKKIFLDDKSGKILMLIQEVGIQKFYPNIKSENLKLIADAFETLEFENLDLELNDKFYLGLLLILKLEPEIAKSVLNDGQIPRKLKSALLDEISGLEGLSLAEASKLQKLLKFSLEKSPEALDLLK